MNNLVSLYVKKEKPNDNDDVVMVTIKSRYAPAYN